MTAFTGVILAGGQGSRMGGQDKGLLPLQGKPLYQHVLQRLQPQVNIVLISANRNIDRYQASGCQVIRDSLPDYPGPLAGMQRPAAQPDRMGGVLCLRYAVATAGFCCTAVAAAWCSSRGVVTSGQRDHPALALVHRALADNLEAWLLRGERRLMQFMCEHGGHSVLFDDDEAAFRNINTPDDLVNEESS